MHGNNSASLGISQCMMMIPKVVSASGSHCLQCRLEASLVETGIMGDERHWRGFIEIMREESSHPVHHLSPHLWENGGIVSVGRPNSMHPPAEIAVVVWLRMHKTIERVCHLSLFHYYHAHRTDA